MGTYHIARLSRFEAWSAGLNEFWPYDSRPGKWVACLDAEIDHSTNNLLADASTLEDAISAAKQALSLQSKLDGSDNVAAYVFALKNGCTYHRGKSAYRIEYTNH